MKTIHLFYNGNEANFPAGNDWEKFTGHDSVRLFLTCAESWRRNGWDVKRISTAKVDVPNDEYAAELKRRLDVNPSLTVAESPDVKRYDFPAQEFTGRIAREGAWYPADNWQLIAKARTLPEDADGEIWIGSFDVFNFGYSPSRGQLMRLWDLENTGCVSFQREHFSLALFCCSHAWLDRAAEILADYDAERLERIPGKYTSDETILRRYAKHCIAPTQAFPLGDYRRFPLIHFARSTLPECYGKIPVV